MKEIPILFSGPMVRAILDGAKTQTRRVVRRHAQITDEDFNAGMEEASRKGWPGVIARGPCDGIQWRTACPYGAVGDHLWVRETWRTAEFDADLFDGLVPTDGVLYAADDEYRPVEDVNVEAWREAHRRRNGTHWRPSIFMPRWASRLTLRVTGVRVERLQAISEADAVAEGISPRKFSGLESHAEAEVSAYGRFALLWDSINGHRAPWDSDPWVFVVNFERVNNVN